MIKIFFDGRYVGETKEPEKLVNEMRDKRRMGLISNQINVAFHQHLDEVRIVSDS